MYKYLRGKSSPTVRGGGGQRVYMNYETTIVGGRRFEVVECAALDAWPANDGQPNKFKGPLFDARIRWIGEDEELASPGSPEAAWWYNASRVLTAACP